MTTKTISRQHMDALQIATKIAGAHHESTYSTFEITFTHLGSTETRTFVIPLEAAVALEEAGYQIKLIGRLAVCDHPAYMRCGQLCPER